jgi:hypothetical protein
LSRFRSVSAGTRGRIVGDASPSPPTATHQIPADTIAVKLLDDNGDSGAEQWKSMVDFVDMNVLWDIDTLD